MNQKDQAIQLSKQGKSIREIAAQLGIGKSTIARWMQETPKSPSFNNHPDPSVHIELRRMELQHELELRKLAQLERAQDLKQRELELQQKFTGNQGQSRDIELRKLLLPIQKWSSHQLQLISRYPNGDIPSTYQGILDMHEQLSQYLESLSDHVHIHQLDEWDECLDILKALISKTEEWLGQLDEIQDSFHPYFDISDENWDDEDEIEEDEENIDQESDENQECYYSWKTFEADLMYLEEIFG